MDEHVNKFHNLGGETIAEHKKNFNVFTKTLQEDPQFDSDKFFENLHPRHRQEEIFHVKLLQIFNRHVELLELLKSGDRILCRIALKDKNFLISLIQKFSGEEFVNKLTPCVSYVTRINLVNKFSYLIDDEGVGEEYYTAVYGKYGLKTASRLLVACSEGFLLKVLEEFAPKLTDRELIYLHKRSPSLLAEYLKVHAKGDYTVKLSTHLAKYDLNEFHRLTQYARFSLGKRMFARYFQNHKELFFNDNFPVTWKKRAVCKLLTLPEFRRLLTKVMKEKRGYRFYREIDYLKYYPRRLRGSILFSAFKTVYGCELWEKPDNVENDLLELLSVEDRVKFDFLESFPELLPLETAIKTLKSKINLTADIHERSELAQKMLVACHVNDNAGAELLDVLKYFHNRHKNDNKDVRSNFLSYLTRTFALEKLGAEYWNLIEEMMLLFEVNNEHLYCLVDLLGKFLVYKMSNGLDFEKELLKFTKVQGRYYRNLSDKVGKFEKVCLLHFPALLPEIYAEEDDRKTAKTYFLAQILDYTRRHPEDPICPYDYFEFWMLLVEQYLENRFLNAYQVVQLLKQKPENVAQKEMYLKFRERIEETGDDGFAPELYTWFLKNRPWVLLKYSEGIIVHAVGWSGNFFYEASKVDYLGLTALLTASATEILADPKSEVSAIKAAIKYLSYQSSNVLSEIATKYAPKPDCEINVREEFTARNLDIQTDLISSFKNTPLPSAHINTLLPFCSADYFKYALEPLYFIMYHTTENQIEGPIFQLLDRAVSVRKHTLHLTAALGCTQLKLRVFAQMAKAEKNLSVQKYIFAKIRNLFIREKTQTSWQLLRDNMHLVSRDDVETLNSLKSCGNVPKKFLNEYLQLIWDYFATFNNGSEFELIAHFDLKNPTIIPFFEQVVRNSLFNPKNKSVEPSQMFTAQYLLLDLENMDGRLEMVWGLIRNYLLSSGEPQAKVRVVYNLINSICNLIQQSTFGEPQKVLIRKIGEKFAELNITTNVLSFELLLKFTAFCTRWDKKFETLAEFLITEFNFLVEKFGTDITHFYADFINNYIYYLFAYNERKVTKLKLVKLILGISGSPRIGLLGLLMLSDDYDDDKDLLEEVLVMLRGNPSPVLRVYLDKYLQDHEVV